REKKKKEREGEKPSSEVELHERKAKKEEEDDRVSNSTFALMNIDEDENYEETEENPNGGETVHSDLDRFRSRLVQLTTGYWEYCLSKWKHKSEMSVDEKYCIALSIIRFLEETFGDEFHQFLYLKTMIKFTRSDLQGKEELIGLVMYLDREKLASLIGFFVLLIALNDNARCDVILPKCVGCCRWNMELIKIECRSALGESVRKERSAAVKSVYEAKKLLAEEFPVIFSSIVGARTSIQVNEECANKVLTKSEKMMSTPYVDGNWTKYSSKFGIKSEWSAYDVCQNAVKVFFRLNRAFKGELRNRLNEFYPDSHATIDKLKDPHSRRALTFLMNLNSFKIFPNGFVFFLLRNKNDEVLEEVCSKLFTLVPSYLKFFNDFGPDFDYKCEGSTIGKRSLELKKSDVAVECLANLKENIENEGMNSTMPIEPTQSSCHYVFQGSIPPSDELEWKFNCKWKVTTFWSRPQSLLQWENENETEMNRLSRRITDYHAATVMRVEHYQDKMKVLTYLKGALSAFLSAHNCTLTITGSSLCSLAALNSNLDVFVGCRTSRIDRAGLVETLGKTEGVTIVRDKLKGSFPITVSSECTGNSMMEVAVHINPGTLYMSHVYQMIDGQDERVASLVVVLKAWRILEYTCVTIRLRSYHVVSLLIHFLQCGVSPPLLPSLTCLYPSLDPTSFRDNQINIIPIPQENNQSISSLLIGFFTYFSDFEFEKYIISIREGCLYKRNATDEIPRTKLSIEHPYIPYHTKPDSIASEIDCKQMRAACRKAKDSLKSTFQIPAIPHL
ncbi:hypothetical protein PFISCL1PPCAC_1931, partial [Pristionchus fissidentatus]